MKAYQNFWMPIAAAAVFSAAIVAPASAQDLSSQLAKQSTLETIKKRGIINIGNSPFRPWVMRDITGGVVGFEIDVGTKLSKDMDVTPNFVTTAWDGIIPALLSGKFDIIIGGMSKTPKRALQVNFSSTYNATGTMIAASRKLAGDFQTVEDFNKTSVVMACRRASTACDKIKQFTPKAKWIMFDDEATALQEVLNGNAHGVPSSWPQVTLWTTENSGELHSPIGSPIQPNPAALAMRKGDFDFMSYINNWIEWNDDYLAERRHYWFGTLDWQRDFKIAPKKKKK